MTRRPRRQCSLALLAALIGLITLSAASLFSNSAMAMSRLPSGQSAIEWVGAMNPAGSRSTPLQVGDAAGLAVSVEVFAPGISDASGQGAGIECSLAWGRVGEAPGDLPMQYSGDAGNNDRYQVILPTATLAAGNHGFTAWCSDDGGTNRVYRAAADGGDGILSMTPVPTPPPGNALVQLFEWRWDDIAQECPWLAQKGYTGVQVPSPAEHLLPSFVSGSPWWVRYQPLSYLLESRSGTAAEFATMVAACDAAGVNVYVDAVINHMANAGGGGLGTAGTFYFGNSYNFPGSHTPADFHYCGTDPGGSQQNDLFDFSDRVEVQTCELLGLADIDTGSATPRATLVNFLQSLLDLGVDGFRIDAAKHMSSSDMEAIFAGLSGNPYIYQEVIDSSNEDVRYYEYLVHGDVTDFGYGQKVGSAVFGCGASLASLADLANGLSDSDDAIVFTDNHDTQRQGGCVLNYQAGPLYDVGNVFMLAHPHGFPRVFSGYHFFDGNAGPPEDLDSTKPVWVDGEPSGCNAADWVCEHRRPAMANLVQLRALAAEQPLTNWWDDGADVIAFGRGDRGFVALNAGSATLTRDWQSAMAPGSYCNIARYEVEGEPPQCRYPDSDFPAPSAELIEVQPGGVIAAYALAGESALAIHAQSQALISDADADGVPDDLDNCSAAANPEQIDSNGDGLGNACDPDLNNDGVVNFLDLGLMKAAFFSQAGDAGWNPDADMNGDGQIDFLDLGALKNFFFGVPGPGALVPPPPPVPPSCGVDDTGLNPAEAFGEVMFLRGNMAGNWAATVGLNDFVNTGDAVYALELQLGPGNFDYKLADEGWAIERSNVEEVLNSGGSVVLQDNGGGSPNADLSIGESGCYRFTLDAADTDFPVLSLQQKTE